MTANTILQDVQPQDISYYVNETLEYLHFLFFLVVCFFNNRTKYVLMSHALYANRGSFLVLIPSVA